MSTSTTNLGLFKYDIQNDGDLPFSITDALNNNWDKIDEFAANGGSLSKLSDTSISSSIANPSALIYTGTKWTDQNLAQVYCVVETYSNGSSWYRKYSDGWCEQGGTVLTGAVKSYPISLLVEMRDTNYTALISNMYLGDDTGGVADQFLIAGASSYGKSTTTLRISTINNANYALNWQVCGYMY